MYRPKPNVVPFCPESCQIASNKSKCFMVTVFWISLKTITGVFSAVLRNWSCVIPVGWAVGSRAGATHKGRRQEIQSEHHRAVIPLEDEVRRRAARPDSDNILQSHAVQQKGSLQRRKKWSNDSPSLTWKTTTNMIFWLGFVQGCTCDQLWKM